MSDLIRLKVIHSGVRAHLTWTLDFYHMILVPLSKLISKFIKSALAIS